MGHTEVYDSNVHEPIALETYMHAGGISYVWAFNAVVYALKHVHYGLLQ